MAHFPANPGLSSVLQGLKGVVATAGVGQSGAYTTAQAPAQTSPFQTKKATDSFAVVEATPSPIKTRHVANQDPYELLFGRIRLVVDHLGNLKFQQESYTLVGGHAAWVDVAVEFDYSANQPIPPARIRVGSDYYVEIHKETK